MNKNPHIQINRTIRRKTEKMITGSRSRKDRKRSCTRWDTLCCYFCNIELGHGDIVQNRLKTEIAICPKCQQTEAYFLECYETLKYANRLPNGAIIFNPSAELMEIFLEYKLALEEMECA
jgi:hypothetical protein